MSAETESMLQKVQQTKNVANKRGKLLQKAVRFLNFRERQERQTEKEWVEGILNQPPYALKDLSREGRQNLTRRRNDLEEDLNENAPPTNISGATKDGLYKLQKELEDQIKSGMPTHEVMRRNPAGAVGSHMRWEAANKHKILAWKNVKRLLDPDNEDPDYTNVETLRPSGLSPETLASSFMANAQIPGVFGMTPLAKANWPEGMPEHGTADSPLKQAERQEIAEEMVAKGYVKADEFEALKEELKKLQTQLNFKESIREKRRENLAKARAARKKASATETSAPTS